MRHNFRISRHSGETNAVEPLAKAMRKEPATGAAANAGSRRIERLKGLARRAKARVDSPVTRLAAASIPFVAGAGAIGYAAAEGDPAVAGWLATVLTSTVYLPQVAKTYRAHRAARAYKAGTATEKQLKLLNDGGYLGGGSMEGMINVADGLSQATQGLDGSCLSSFVYYGLAIDSLPIITVDAIGLALWSVPAYIKLREAARDRSWMKTQADSSNAETENRPGNGSRTHGVEGKAHPLAKLAIPFAAAGAAMAASAALRDPAIAGGYGGLTLAFLYAPQAQQTLRLKKAGKAAKAEQLSLGLLTQDGAAITAWAAYGAMIRSIPILAAELGALAFWSVPAAIIFNEAVKRSRNYMVSRKGNAGSEPAKT